MKVTPVPKVTKVSADRQTTPSLTKAAAKKRKDPGGFGAMLTAAIDKIEKGKKK